MANKQQIRTLENEVYRLRLEKQALADRLKIVDEDKRLWKHMAVHTLHDLRMLGVPIEKILGMTPDVLNEVDTYSRNSTSYT